MLFLEAVLTCQYLKKNMASRLEWKKLGESVSFVYYEQALKGKKLRMPGESKRTNT